MKKTLLNYDYDDIEYREIRDVRNSFSLSVDEDYYKPIKINDAFNRNYSFQLNMKVKEIKTKTLKIKEYLNMIRPYLRGIINGHKTQGE